MPTAEIIITTKPDFAAMLWPAGTVDLDSEPGTVLLAPGVTVARAKGPGYLHPGYSAVGDWRPLECDLGLTEGTSFVLRWTCAASASGLATSAWTLWRDVVVPASVEGHPEITHHLRFDPTAALLNDEDGIQDVGPYFNIEVRLAR